MGIRKQEFYEGAALHLLVRGGKVTNIRYRPPLFVINRKYCVLLKYSTKIRSPWGFTFTPAEQKLLRAVAAECRTVRAAIGKLAQPGRGRDALHNLPRLTRKSHVQALIADIPKNGGSRTQLANERQLACHLKSTGFKDIYGRMAWDDVAPTITGGCFNPSKGRFLHPDEDRAITMREAALLQSFPKTYSFPLNYGKVALAMMIGNALPPEFIRRHALAVAASLEEIRSGHG
jgi:site-specific DNA-cytosine methylase